MRQRARLDDDVLGVEGSLRGDDEEGALRHRLDVVDEPVLEAGPRQLGRPVDVDPLLHHGSTPHLHDGYDGTTASEPSVSPNGGRGEGT